MITLQLDIFEGPLDLLLYLIRKNDLEISRVSLASITDQYLKYLDTLRELDIDVASEFLYMAAELTHIKSRTLLPDTDSEEVEEEDDVAKDLVARLREYEQYKLAALGFKQRPWLNRDIFARGAFDVSKEFEGTENDPDNEFYEVDTFALIKALSEILDKLPKEELRHRIEAERVSITERLYEILEALKTKESMLFEELFAGDKTRADVVLSFLAVLEMARLMMIRIYQTGPFEPIRVQRKVEVGEEVIAESEKVKEELETYKG